MIISAVPTFHPSAVMRNGWVDAPTVISDLKKTLIIPPQNYNLFPSLSDAANYKHTSFALDIETNRFTNEITMVGFSHKPYEAIVFPFKGPYIAEIKRIVGAATEIIGQNIIDFDMPTLERNGIFAAKDSVIQDLMLGHALVSPDAEHNLGYIGSIYTNVQAWKHTASTAKEHYNATDCDVTLQSWNQIKALLKQLELWDIYRNVSIPAAMVCREMKRVGLKLDHRKISEVRERIKSEQQVLETTLPNNLRAHSVPINKRVLAPPGTVSAKTGKPLKYTLVASSELVVPWRSDKLVGEWLYAPKTSGGLGLPIQKHIKTGKTTTDKIALAKLAKSAGSNSEAIKSIMKLRTLDETLTTFSKESMKYTSDIHANFNVHGTNSGRLSSSSPNMQNIPDTVRTIYIPHYPNYKIIQCDFSGIENRLTAYLAHDEERLARFNLPGFSEHKFAVEKFYGTPMDQVEKSSNPDSEYSKAKHIVHGSNYGLGARKMSTMYGIPEKEVKGLIAKWKAAIPKTSAWQEATAEEAKTKGYLTNPFDRKRWFGTPTYYTESLSFLPQSTAADMILRAMIGLMFERVGWPIERAMLVCPIIGPLPREANLLVQVHDALVVEAPTSKVQETVDILRKVMEQPWRELANFSCPIAIEWGDAWGELVKYEG